MNLFERCHLIGAYWDNLALFINALDYIAKSIKLSESFLWNHTEVRSGSESHILRETLGIDNESLWLT